MSWTTPPTFFSGTVVTASNLNILSSDLSYLKTGADGVAFSGAKVYRTSSLSLPTGTNTDVVWQAEYFDVGAWWSSGATLTVPASAVPSGYSTVALSISAVFRFSVNATGGRAALLVQNGSTVDTFNTASLSGDFSYLNLTAVIAASAADTIKFQLLQSSGSTLTADTAKMSVYRIAPIS